MWKTIKTWAVKAYTWVVRYPLALIIAVFVVAGAAVLMFFGAGDRFNVGGILGKLFGTKPSTHANVVPDDREVPIGKPDDKGWVQHEVEVLDVSSNPFRDKEVIHVKTEDGVKKVSLPQGVRDTDVDHVIVVGSSDIQVVVKSGPKPIEKSTIDFLR